MLRTIPALASALVALCAFGAPARAQTSAADVVVRLEQLESQVRALTGMVEQLQFRNQQLERQLRGAQDAPPPPAARAVMPAPGVATAQPQPLPPPAAPIAGQSGRRADVFDPAQMPSAPGAPRPLGSTVPSQPLTPAELATEPPVGAPSGRAAGAPLDLSSLSGQIARDPAPIAEDDPQGPPGAGGLLPPPPPRNPNATGVQGPIAALPPAPSSQSEFDLAHKSLQQKNYPVAEEGFRAFLRKYAADPRAGDAQYWLGESLFQRQRYRDAADAFLGMSQKYDRHAKAPDALLRLGQSLAALGENELACATLGEVGRKYPRASRAVKQGVEREQKRVRC